MFRIPLLFCLGLLVLASLGCDKEPRQAVVTYQLSYRADTTFSKIYRDQINRDIDSLCSENRDVLYKKALDSLWRMEVIKIEELMAK